MAYLNSRKSRNLAEKSVKVVERAERRTSINNLDTQPSLDVLDVIEINGKERVKILITNMRSTPFRIHSLSVSQEILKSRNISNYIKSKTDPDFEWNYNPVGGCIWNPKGNLDDSEKYVREAAQFLVVSKSETIMVTVPNFNEHNIYRFRFDTSHGNIAIAGSISKNGKITFCKECLRTYA